MLSGVFNTKACNMVFVKRIKTVLERVLRFKSKYGSLWNYRHGFYKETVELNGITRTNYTSFLDNKRYYAGHPYNKVFSSIIDNKLFLPILLKDYPDNVPLYYFYIDRGKIFSMTKTFKDGLYGLLDLLKENKRLVLKQCYSSVGKGFYLLESGSIKQGVVINKSVISIDEFEKVLGQLHDYVCTEYVEQHEYSRNVCSTSLNTIRFLCVRDEESGLFNIMRCFHRFGVEGSIVDNLGGGGKAYLFFIDIESGTLKGNGMYALGEGEHYSDNLEYPNAKAYKGMIIPRFEEVKKGVLGISNSFPFLRYVGWDVAITQGGFKIIEANSLTSLGVLQREGGFLEDEKLRNFFLG